MVQAEADVDSLMEQVSQAETKNRSPFKRRSGLTDEEMGRASHSHQALIHTLTHSPPLPGMLATLSPWTLLFSTLRLSCLLVEVLHDQIVRAHRCFDSVA